MINFNDFLNEAKEKWLGTDDHKKQPNLVTHGNLLHKEQTLNDKEKYILKGYQHSSSSINYYNRNNKEHDDIGFNHLNNHIDSVIAKHTTEHPVHLWRGIKSQFTNSLKPGDTFNDKGFVSTSLDPSIAKSFGDEGNLIHIKVPKGSKAIYPNQHQKNMAPFPSQHEVILPRNSRFKYEGSTYEGNNLIHHVTHIPENSNDD